MSDEENPWQRARPKPRLDKRERERAARGEAPRPAAHERPARTRAHERPANARPSHERPPRELPSRERPSHERPSHEHTSHERHSHEHPSRERPSHERASRERPSHERPSHERPSHERPSHGRPAHERTPHERPSHERLSHERPLHARPSHEPAAREHLREAHGEEGASHAARRNADEVRLYGINACRAAFENRPQDLRKVYLAESRIGALRDVLAWCVKHRLGYRVVEAEDLDRLAASTHHEGVVFEMRRAAQPSLRELLATAGDGAQVLLWLDGVGNPHNFGAVLRSAAHFGAAGVLLPPGSPLTLSGAAARVAEGGAEAVPAVHLENTRDAIAALQAAGYTLAATLPREARSLYDAALPQKLVLVFGAEGEGMQPELVRACSLHLLIPGSGRVESLNIANAAAVMLGEWWRRHRS